MERSEVVLKLFTDLGRVIEICWEEHLYNPEINVDLKLIGADFYLAGKTLFDNP